MIDRAMIVKRGKADSMPQKASSCPVARTAKVIATTWTCLILRDLLLNGGRRFQDFQNGLQGIAPTTLSDRLRKLEQAGIVERHFYSMNPPRAEYRLTAKGRDLGPIVRAMRDWGSKYDH
jgi:DNA-binding HxlR family transcriptional regulator